MALNLQIVVNSERSVRAREGWTYAENTLAPSESLFIVANSNHRGM